MSVTKAFTSQAVTEWVKIFPRHVTENFTSSVTFMKQLTVVAISTITYLKNVFPEDSYSTQNFSGIKLRILKKKCRDEMAQFVSAALTQAFEAFEKKYLKQLVICFYDTECKTENLLEYHIFEYEYNQDGVAMNIHSKQPDKSKRTTKFTFENVKDRTLHLIKACVVIMQACQSEMPEVYDISVRLYYNDDAPEGYQAPGFSPGAETEDQLEPTLDDTIKLGSVHTPYHSLTMMTYIKETMDSSHEVIPSENPPVLTLNEQDEFESSSAQKTTSDDEPQIVCPCNKDDYDITTHCIITCQYCGARQHGACFGVRRAAGAGVRGARHCCAACADADAAREPTDRRLADLPAKKRECLCIFRRTLEWASSMTAVCARDLMNKFDLSPVNASKLMKLLHSHDIIDNDPDSDLVSPRRVIHEALQEVINNFFLHEEMDIVDRLMEESQSQHSQCDPVGDVLGPMEKVNLHDASTIYKVVDAEPQPVVENETLKQYRDAILANEVVEEELPLSGSHNPINVEKKETFKRKIKDQSVKWSGVRTKKSKKQ